MRPGAPAVAFEVHPSGAWRAFVAALAVGGVACAVAWVALDDERRLSVVGWAVAVLASVACVATAASLWPRGRGRLAFDGEGWTWQPPASAGGGVASTVRPVRPRVAVDLGRVMLLQLVPVEPTDGARRRWVALERGADAPTWHAMRCALHDTRPAPAPAATTPAADRGGPR